MVLPRWLAKVNRLLFNPMEIRRGRRPVLQHVGRRTQQVHLTPLDAHRTTSGFIFPVRYGPKSDWVRNVVASGTAILRFGDESIEVADPRVTSLAEALDALPSGYEPPKDFAKAGHYLLMDFAVRN